MSDGRTEWTQDRPTLPGFYWVSDMDGGRVNVLEVWTYKHHPDGVLRVGGECGTVLSDEGYDDWRWKGPLDEPSPSESK